MKKSKIIKLLVVVFVLETLFLGGLTIYNSNVDVRNTITLATTVKPETFTELYFNDHLNLPTSITPKKNEYFSFTIHNLEHKKVKYQYRVYVNEDVSANLIKAGTVELKHDQSEVIIGNYTFEVKPPFDRARITVMLINKNQDIGFWIGEENK